MQYLIMHVIHLQACMTRRSWWAWTLCSMRPASVASGLCSCSLTTGPCTEALTSTTSGLSRLAVVSHSALSCVVISFMHFAC